MNWRILSLLISVFSVCLHAQDTLSDAYRHSDTFYARLYERPCSVVLSGTGHAALSHDSSATTMYSSPCTSKVQYGLSTAQDQKKVHHSHHAIQNKQITLRDALKGATQFAVQWKTQDKLLKGLGTICSTAKTKAIEFAKKNPLSTPQEYMTTPEGVIFKTVSNRNGKAGNAGGNGNSSNKNIREKLEWTRHKSKHKPPKNVLWKEIVKQTKHGEAKYKPGIIIEELEKHAWEHGVNVTSEKTWKVFKANEIIGAKNGNETRYIRIECSANTLHGHPILEEEARKYLK